MSIKKKEKERLQYIVGQKIRELREKANMEQQVLAAKCDIEKSALSRIEAGRTGPTLWTLYKISKGLECKLSELLEFKKIV